MSKFYDIKGNEIIVAGTENVSDTLLGTLPYKVGESGCYIISETDATISTGDGAEQLLDLGSNVNFSLANGAYNHASYEVKGKNTLDVSFADINGNAIVYFNPTMIEAGKTYTLFAKLESSAINKSNCYVRMMNGAVQMGVPLNGDFVCKTVTTESDNLGGPYVGIPLDSTNTKVGDTFTFTLYLFEGELTAMPEGVDFDIQANTKYYTDGYMGCTLESVNGDEVKVYRSNSGEGQTDSGGVIFFGDSILHFSDVTSRYANKTGKATLNCAVGGTRMSASRETTNAYYPMDMANIADAIASGDFSAQLNSGLATGGLTALATANVLNYKAMVLEFGTNDFSAKVPFNGNDKTSVEGALKHILTTILTKYPTMRIVVLSTLQYVTLGDGDESGVPTHEDGTVWEMNEVIKNVCESSAYNVPFIDMYHAMGQNGMTRDVLTSDGVHLMNPTGCKRYADILTAKLNGLGI